MSTSVYEERAFQARLKEYKGNKALDAIEERLDAGDEDGAIEAARESIKEGVLPVSESRVVKQLADRYAHVFGVRLLPILKRRGMIAETT